MRYGSVEAMVAWLDRDETAAERERRYRNAMRRLPPGLRRFMRALRRVLLVEPGPGNLHREKIMKRLQIKATRYYELRSGAEKSSFEGLWVEGARDEKPGASPPRPFRLRFNHEIHETHEKVFNHGIHGTHGKVF